MSKFVVATSYRPIPELIYQLFIKFHKPSSPGSSSFCFCVLQLRGDTGKKVFPYRAVMPMQQLNLLPKVPTGHTMVVGWPRMSVQPRTVLAMAFASCLCVWQPGSVWNPSDSKDQ